MTPQELNQLVAAIKGSQQLPLLPFQLATQLAFSETNVVIPANSSAVLTTADPNRVFLMISTGISSVVSISTKSSVAGGVGIALPSAEPRFSMSVQGHGTMPQLAWNGFSTGGPFAVSVFAITWRPPIGR